MTRDRSSRNFVLVVLFLLLFGALLASAQQRAGIAESGDRDGELESLGQKLFHDPILSSNGKVSCASCHSPANGYASEGLPTGVTGKRIPRRAPSLWDVKDRTLLMWDGRAKTLEEQALLPLLNQDEMGNESLDRVADRVGPKYGVAKEGIAPALAAYQRTLVHGSSRWERHVAGERAYTTEEARGWDLFRGKAGCYQCHDPKRGFADDALHDTGLGLKAKTPALRGCRDTGPWMHDASLKTLEAVVEHYNSPPPGVDPKLKPLKLSAREKADLAAFLRSL